MLRDSRLVKTQQAVLPARGTAAAHAAPCRAATRRKAAIGRQERRSVRGVLIVRPLRTHGEHNGHKARVSFPEE